MTREWTLEQTIKFFNKKYAIVDHDGTVDILKYADQDIVFNSISSRREFWRHARTKLRRGVSEPAFNFWLSSSRAHRFEGLIFDPSQNPENPDKAVPPGRPFNIWKGWAVKPKKGTCSRFLNHVRDVICAGDPTLYWYLSRYVAHLFQKPNELPEIAIVLRGGQGIGKGVFVNNLCRLISPAHYLHIASSDLLVGRFSAHFAGKLLIFADESFWAGEKKAEGRLKSLITEDIQTVEPKGKPPFTIQNKCRLFIASNERWVIPAGLDERRYCFLDVAETRKKDFTYFSKIQQELDNGGLQALLYHFLHVDLSDFEIRNPPMTEGLAEQKLENADSVTRFWFEEISAKTLFEECEEDGYIPKIKVYSRYKSMDSKTKYREPETTFWKSSKRLLGEILEGPRKTLTRKPLNRVKTCVLPSLDDARSKLFGILGIKATIEPN